MDMAIGDLIKFNELLDSAIDPKSLDEEFITSKQSELGNITKGCDVKHKPIIALSYAKLMELTVLLAGKYADNCQSRCFGDLVINPRHIDVCILNVELIQEEYGIENCFPRWFKQQVRACLGSQYSEDLGKMVVDPSLLLHFVEEGFLLGMVKKERHGRLSDQFRGFVSGDTPFSFSKKGKDVRATAHNPVKALGCGGGRGKGRKVESWLASSTVLNVVKNTLQSDLMNVLRESMSDDYLKSIDKRFAKAFQALNYVEIGRKSCDNFPYADEVPISDWAKINNTLCHFTLDGYGMIQSELDKSLSSPSYESPYMNRLLHNVPEHRAQVGHDFVPPLCNVVTSPGVGS